MDSFIAAVGTDSAVRLAVLAIETAGLSTGHEGFLAASGFFWADFGAIMGNDFDCNSRCFVVISPFSFSFPFSTEFFFASDFSHSETAPTFADLFFCLGWLADIPPFPSLQLPTLASIDGDGEFGVSDWILLRLIGGTGFGEGIWLGEALFASFLTRASNCNVDGIGIPAFLKSASANVIVERFVAVWAPKGRLEDGA